MTALYFWQIFKIIKIKVSVMNRMFVALASLSLLVVASCGKTSTNGKSLKIAGGTAHLKVMKDVADMLQEQGDFDISINGGGSGVGIKSVGEGMVDIGNSGRDLTATEISTYGLVPHKIATDGIAVIVNPKNATANLTLEQIKNIFTGKVTNWKELGGADAKINIYTRDSKSGTRKTFSKLALSKEKIIKDAIVVSSNGNMKQSLSNDPNGIGYMSVGYLDNSVKGVAVENVIPSVETIVSGAYKIQRYLFSVTKGEPNGAVKEFLDMLLSDKGQAAVSKRGLIPVK